MHGENSKTFFIEKVIGECGGEAAAPLRLLDLGCGTAAYIPYLLKKFEHLEYVGLEPYGPSFKKAKENVGDHPRARLFNQLGYTDMEGVEKGSFDVVMSMSALEHIKQLDRFIALSAAYAKAGGLIVHRYDLGHALTPGSLKERFQIFLGNNVPNMLPEHKFVRYVQESEVRALLKKETGKEPYRSTYHQMPSHKRFEKAGKAAEDHEAFHKACRELYEWEWRYRELIARLPREEREALFPSVAVWSRK